MTLLESRSSNILGCPPKIGFVLSGTGPMLLFTLCLTVLWSISIQASQSPAHATNKLDHTLNEFAGHHGRSIVQVESHRRTQNGTRRLWSTGVVLEGGFVATCTDGAQPTDSLHIFMVDGGGGAARFISQDPLLGISLLRLQEPHRYRPFVARDSHASVREGDAVVLLSFVAGKGKMESRVGRLERIFAGMVRGSAGQLEVVVGNSRDACGSAVLDGNGHFLGLVVDCPVELSDAPLAPPRPDWVDGDRSLQALSRGTLLAAVARLTVPREPEGFLGVDATRRTVAAATLGEADLTSAPVEVLRVLAGSPAEVAGIQAQDFLLEIERLPINDVDDVHQRIRNTPPGTDVTITVLRDGFQVHLVARVGDRSWLEWMDRRLRRNSGRQKNIRREIRELEMHLERLVEEERRYQ